jgi:hypothetical protein
MKFSFRSLAAALALALLTSPLIFSQSADPNFDAIKAKHDRGEPITPEERSYAQSVMAQRNQQNAAQRNPEYARQHPPRESTGLVPLPDLGVGDYHGQQGGLYLEGRNMPPPAHAAAGLKLARAILPLDAAGHPFAGGKIVLLTVGMSNTTQESQVFQRLAAADPDLNPHLVIVDGAQGGQTANVTARPDANYWSVNAARLRAAGVTAEQVQMVWLKQANAGPTQPFPIEAKKLEADLVQALHNLHEKFPNLKITYLSSRTYGGYAGTPLNPEPHAYETGFAVKWLIADQIAGAAELNFDSAKGAVRAPWLAWGAYLWTDGTKGRQDGFVWQREDCGPDGTHPSDSGRKKVAELLLKFFKTEPTAQPWFLKKSP